MSFAVSNWLRLNKTIMNDFIEKTAKDTKTTKVYQINPRNPRLYSFTNKRAISVKVGFFYGRSLILTDFRQLSSAKQRLFGNPQDWLNF